MEEKHKHHVTCDGKQLGRPDYEIPSHEKQDEGAGNTQELICLNEAYSLGGCKKKYKGGQANIDACLKAALDRSCRTVCATVKKECGTKPKVCDSICKGRKP